MNPRTYVISLPNAERRKNIERELREQKIWPGNLLFLTKFIHAQEPAQGFTMSNMRRNPRNEFGCALSHLKAIMEAVSDNADTALFIEDDVVFSQAARQFPFPEGWDVIYLGGHPRGPVKQVSPGMYQVSGFSFAEAYMLNWRSMREFVRFWCDRSGQKDAMFDIILGEFAAQGRGYALYPTLTHQPPGWSQIGGKHDDKRELVERGWRNNIGA